MDIITFYTVIINVSPAAHIQHGKVHAHKIISSQHSLNHGSSIHGLKLQVCSPLLSSDFIQDILLTPFEGYTWSFAAQAIICTFGVVPTYIVLQKYGPKWRKPMMLGRAKALSSSTESLS